MSRIVRIACIDREPDDRVALRDYLNDVCKQYRASVGHTAFVQPYPASSEEVFFSAAPQAFAIGGRMGMDETYSLCSDLHCAYPEVPIFLFLEPARYQLRTLRHFDKFCCQIFSVEESSLRIIHEFLLLSAKQEESNGGKIITVQGVKGGTGVTSLVLGFAHAAQALGLRVLVVDFSYGGVIPFYLACDRWDSAEYASALSEGIAPDPHILERCIVEAPTKVKVLLPPAGGSAIRELWLRSADTFEHTLSAFDYFAMRFDLILIDQAGVEGVLPFALRCRADTALLVSSNDAASVHLLGHLLTNLAEAPGDMNARIVLNELRPDGVTRADMVEFLSLYPAFDPEMALEMVVPHDTNGRNWIGSGSNFYTASRKRTKIVLDALLRDALTELHSDLATPTLVGRPKQRPTGLLSRFFRPKLVEPGNASCAEQVPRLMPANNLTQTSTPYYVPPTQCELGEPDENKLF